MGELRADWDEVLARLRRLEGLVKQNAEAAAAHENHLASVEQRLNASEALHKLTMTTLKFLFDMVVPKASSVAAEPELDLGGDAEADMAHATVIRGGTDERGGAAELAHVCAACEALGEAPQVSPCGDNLSAPRAS
jgi:hypothetical protein